MDKNSKRDNKWLEEKMYLLWEENFSDVPRKNRVIIKFGKKAKKTLGSIKWLKSKDTSKEFDDPRVTQITVSRLFMDDRVPEDVVLGTIAHEMIHYAHGFSSPLEQRYAHPHKGGIIKKEMYARGLKEMYDSSQSWIKANWQKFVEENYGGFRGHRRFARRTYRGRDILDLLFSS